MAEPRNEALVAAIIEAAGGGDSDKRRRVYEELLRSQLILQLAPGAVPGGPEGGVRLVALEREDGQTGLAAFSDVAALQAWKPDAKEVIAVPGRGLFQMALQGGFDAVVINPAGPAAWDVLKQEFPALSEGRVPDAPKPGETLLRCEISPPDPPVPAEALAHVRAALEPRPEVSACWFFTLALGNDAPVLYLGLGLSLPIEEFSGFVNSLTALREVPGLPDGFMVGPLTPELVPGAEKFGVPVLKRSG